MSPYEYGHAAFADIDGDGDLDAFFGQLYGNTVFFANTGSASTPAFAAPSTNPFGLSDVGAFASPEFADIDGDGDLDAIIGASDWGFLSGRALFFENTGTATAPAFASASSNPFGLAVGNRPSLAFADIDADGDLDALVGVAGGRIDFFENVSAVGCPAAPQSGCTTGFVAASLQVNEKTAGKEKVQAKLLRGPTLGQTALGNPLAAGGTFYDLCIYDDQDDLVAQLDVDRAGDSCGTRPCWLPIGGLPPAGKGYIYKDGDASASGVTQLKVQGGAKSQIQVTAQNNVRQGETSLSTGIAAQLTATTSVTVQLRTSDAGCFSATLDDVVKQDSNFFKAK